MTTKGLEIVKLTMKNKGKGHDEYNSKLHKHFFHLSIEKLAKQNI
jgi:hypothetical protein